MHVSRACHTGHMHERRSERPPRTAPAACWAAARPKDSSRQALSKPNFLARPRRSCGTWLTGSRRRAGHISLVAQPCPVLPIRTPKIAFSMFEDQACEISHFRISQRREALVWHKYRQVRISGRWVAFAHNSRGCTGPLAFPQVSGTFYMLLSLAVVGQSTNSLCGISN